MIEIDGKIVSQRIVGKDELEGGRVDTLIPMTDKKRKFVLNSKTYALKSQLLTRTLYITISDDDGKPFELFFNSRDNDNVIELTIISRLLSAVFRSNQNVKFVIDELKGVSADGVGYLRPPRGDETKGHFIPSIYYEIAEIIEYHINGNVSKSIVLKSGTGAKCPSCGSNNTKMEDGCMMCLECGFSKCG